MAPLARPVRSTRVLDVRSGDQVLVLTGKDAGKKGTVTKVITNQQGWKKSTARYGAGWQTATPLIGAAVVVEGINIAKRSHQAAHLGRSQRPPAACPAGRHPRDPPAPQHQQRHDHLPVVLAPHAHQARHGSRWTQRARLHALRRAADQRGEEAQVSSELHKRYNEEVVPALRKEFGYDNVMQVPRLTKIVVNIGLGEALRDSKAIDAAVGDMTLLTGQKPVVTRARRSIAQFRLRTGNAIGVVVTLRGERMWDFLERLTRVSLPRIRDFRGVPGKSFDGRGNYSLGLKDQLAFPEIDYDRIDRLRGLEVSIVTTATTDEESKRMLALLGMPFAG